MNQNRASLLTAKTRPPLSALGTHPIAGAPNSDVVGGYVTIIFTTISSELVSNESGLAQMLTRGKFSH